MPQPKDTDWLNGYKNKLQKIKKMLIETYISIITLNINGLNDPNQKTQTG